MYDCIALGSLNVDYLLADPPDSDDFEPNQEHRISEPAMDAYIEKYGFEAKVLHGGSALNFAEALKSADPRLNVAYIGVEGTPISGLSSFKEHLQTLGIDESNVYSIGEMPGRCISRLFPKGRSLKTSLGANAAFGDLVMHQHKADVLQKLSQTRALHVTSLFGDKDAELIADFLSELRVKIPSIQISVDPGFRWCSSEATHVVRIMAASDFVLLNQEEFENVTEPYNQGSDIERASALFDALEQQRALMIVIKRYDSIKLYDYVSETAKARRVPFERIENSVDDTGAGDVFAAGFVLATLLPSAGIYEGVTLGNAMAKEKLRFHGKVAYTSFPAIVTSERNRLRANNKLREQQICHEVPSVYLPPNGKQTAIQGETKLPPLTLEYILRRADRKDVALIIGSASVLIGSGFAAGHLGIGNALRTLLAYFGI